MVVEIHDGLINEAVVCSITLPWESESKAIQPAMHVLTSAALPMIMKHAVYVPHAVIMSYKIFQGVPGVAQARVPPCPRNRRTFRGCMGEEAHTTYLLSIHP